MPEGSRTPREDRTPSAQPATKPAPGGPGGAVEPRAASPAQILQLQRQYGNRAVCQLISRKYQNLPQPKLHPPLEEVRADKIDKEIDNYNATPEWGQLEGETLKSQVRADDQALPQIESTIKLQMGERDSSAEEYKDVRAIQLAIREHKDQLRAKSKELAAKEEAAKPLKDRFHSGIAEDELAIYKSLAGDHTDMADLADEDVSRIINLYTTGGHLSSRKVWVAEQTRRARQSRDLGGDSGWVTELLTPNKDDLHVAAALDLVGTTANADLLAVETMIKIIDELHQAKSTGGSEVASFFMRQVDKRSAEEPTESVKGKAAMSKKRATELKSNALSKLGGGQTWKDLRPQIDNWWEKVKKAAADDTFATAFQAKRMTVRAIAKDSGQQGGKFPAQIPKGESGTTTGKTDMTLDRNRESIKTRTKPETWTGESQDLTVKQKTGLYELSASLLSPDRDIFSQLKFYSAPEAVVFMPAASPEDYQILLALTELVDADQAKLREISSEMTRIVLAQSTDMGTKYVDKSPDNLGTDIRYGETGTLIRYAGGTGKPAREHELEARRTNALEYTKILDDSKKLVNEVVVEYRKHASGRFPLFTEIDHKNKRFYILDPTTFQRTGKYIDNSGNEAG